MASTITVVQHLRFVTAVAIVCILVGGCTTNPVESRIGNSSPPLGRSDDKKGDHILISTLVPEFVSLSANSDQRLSLSNTDARYSRLLFDNRQPRTLINEIKLRLAESTLNEAENLKLEGWLVFGQDADTYGYQAGENRGKVFQVGSQHYRLGIIRYHNSDVLAAQQAIEVARRSLVPFVLTSKQNDWRVAQALLMLGHMQGADGIFDRIPDNPYFREVIYRFPYSSFAREAFQMLHENADLLFTGSSGEKGPESVVQMLHSYERLVYAPTSESYEQRPGSTFLPRSKWKYEQ